MDNRMMQWAVGLVVALWALPSSAALVARYLDADATPDAYYDSDRNITWLADANYAQTSGFDADGRMVWAAAMSWAAALDPYGSGITGWRLPAVTDTGTPGCTGIAYSGTDCGYNVNTATGEMAHMFYDELGNLAQYTTGGVQRPPHSPGGLLWGLVNEGPFSNLIDSRYWTSTDYAPNNKFAWQFYFYGGLQDQKIKKDQAWYAWAVHDGDVGAAAPVPVPAAVWLLGSGLIGLAAFGRRRRLPLR